MKCKMEMAKEEERFVHARRIELKRNDKETMKTVLCAHVSQLLKCHKLSVIYYVGNEKMIIEY